jgi:hypothetical protein
VIAAAVGEAGLAVVFAMVFVGAGSLLVRFRRGSDVERAQLKWLLFAAAVFSARFVVDLVTPALPGVANQVLNTLIFAGFYVAIGIAILRYRLYEIDRLISRTIAYGVITGVLALVYLGAVVALGRLARPLTGSSQLAVAGATLLVAAMFQPARRHIQAVIDRRFNRARYDAQHTMEAFRARMREEVDMGQLEAEVVPAVRATVAPAQVVLWLRVPERAR